MNNSTDIKVIKSYNLHGAKDLRLEDSELEHSEEEVLVKVHSVGICGSDIHYYMHGRCGEFIPKTPFSLGHEFSGTVESAAPNNKGIKAGDHVAINPLLNCGDCEYCKKGYGNLCANKRYMGSAAVHPHTQGALREFMSAPIQNTYLLPDSVSYAEGAMIEPAAVALHALKKAGDIKGKEILITGGGTIGQLILRIAVLSGAKVDLSDLKEYSLEMAKKGGARNTINPEKDKLEDMSYDVVYEASGAASAYLSAFSCVKKLGTIIQVGTLPDHVEIPGNTIMYKELTIAGTLQFGSEFPEALDLIADRKLNVADLINQRFSFDETAKAIEFAAKGEDSIKVQVEI